MSRFLAEMADWIAATAAADPQATGIAIEIPDGPAFGTSMERGHSDARALRGVADRLLRAACAILENQTDFNPNHATQTWAA